MTIFITTVLPAKLLELPEFEEAVLAAVSGKMYVEVDVSSQATT